MENGVQTHIHQKTEGMKRMSFYEWMLSRYARKDTPRGDLAADMKHAGDFPDTCDRAVILNYLDGKFACDEAIKVFKRAFRDYRRAVAQWDGAR